MKFDFDKCFKDIGDELTPDLKTSILEAVENNENISTLVGAISGITTGHAIDVNYRVMIKYHEALMEYLASNYQRHS